MRKCLIVIGMAVCYLSGWGQGFQKFDFEFGGATEFTKFSQFNEFVTNYNSTVNVKSPLSEFKRMNGFYAGCGIRSKGEKFHFSTFLLYQYLAAPTNQAVYDDSNRKRTLDLSTRDVYLYSEFGGGRRTIISGYYGLNISFARLVSSLVYSDGSQSVGAEYMLSGVYTSFSMDFDLGVSLRQELTNRLGVHLRASVLSMRFVLSEEQEKDLEAFADRYPYRSIFGTEFPLDVAAYNSSGGLISQYESVGGGLRGPRLHFGLTYSIYTNAKN